MRQLRQVRKRITLHDTRCVVLIRCRASVAPKSNLFSRFGTCSNIDIWDEKKQIETLNSVNRQKRRLLHFCKTESLFFKWQLLTASSHPSPNFTEWSLGRRGNRGETNMAPYDNGALVQLTSNESTDSVRTELSLSVQ